MSHFSPGEQMTENDGNDKKFLINIAGTQIVNDQSNLKVARMKKTLGFFEERFVLFHRSCWAWHRTYQIAPLHVLFFIAN